MDISIVGPDDRVLYYSDSPERIFPRNPAVLGRSAQNCHPQQSVHIVEKILTAFKRGEKDKARFWLELHGKFVVIEYFALRSAEEIYLGTLEVNRLSADAPRVHPFPDGFRRASAWACTPCSPVRFRASPDLRRDRVDS